MNYTEAIKELIEFFKLHLDEVPSIKFDKENPEKDLFIHLDANLLLEHDLDLYEFIINNPVEGLSCLEYVYQDTCGHKVNIILDNAPGVQDLTISKIRLHHVEKIYNFKGMLKRKTPVFAKLKYINYLCENSECPFSEQKLKIAQIKDKPQTIKSCVKCRSKVNIVEREHVNYQVLILEELSEDTKGTPKVVQVDVESGLTSFEEESKINVGSKLELLGLIHQKDKKQNDQESIYSEFMIKAVNIKSLEQDLDDIQLTKEDTQNILELSKKEDIIQLLTNSVAPTIQGQNSQKTALVCSLVGGNKTGARNGRMSMCLIGDPGTGKSQFLYAVQNLMPKTVYASGESSTGVGLTASIVQDEITGRRTVEAGAMVQAHKGLFLIDELDKLRKEESTKMNNGIENGEIPLNKAGINTTLPTETTVIGAANPKYGKFDNTKDLYKQVDIEPTLLSRFDFIFFLLDIANEEKDNELVDFLLGDIEKPEIIEEDLLRKYLLYAKTFNPVLNIEAKSRIKEYFVKHLRKKNDGANVRQFNGIKRASEALAKLQLKTEVTLKEMNMAIQLMESSQKEFEESELLTGISNKTRSKIKILQNVLEDFKDNNVDLFTIDDIMKHTIIQNTPSLGKLEVQELLDKLRQEGEIFMPLKNKYKCL